MLWLYIRKCENSTLANVLTPFCTALGVQTPLYRDRILYSNEGQIPLYCIRILYRIAYRYMRVFAMQYNRGESQRSVRGFPIGAIHS